MIYKSPRLPPAELSFGSQSPDAGIKFWYSAAGGRMIESKDDNSELRRGFNTMKLQRMRSAQNNGRAAEIHRNLRWIWGLES